MMMNTPDEKEKKPHHIVNPIALQNCTVRGGETTAKVLDISFVRVVVETDPAWESKGEEESIPLDFSLDRQTFGATVRLTGRGEGWLRFGFEKIVPSARAHLRSFLSPKKIGESLIEDWRTDSLRHYHGLNESELWFEPNGGVLFTYLDQASHDQQFLIRVLDSKAPLQVGKIRRADYMAMEKFDTELPLEALTDRDLYANLGPCRDIVTNFRPIGQMEYALKQRLLKQISDTLYSASHRVDMLPPRPARVVTLPVENP